jgi:fructose-1,6-bisphosphatase/inositol monophosphatase family enzyme
MESSLFLLRVVVIIISIANSNLNHNNGYIGKVIGIIDQPVLRERWVGVKGEETKLNGLKINTRSCTSLDSAYL